MKEKSKIDPECGTRLKEILHRKRITQLELSTHSDFTPQYISCIIRGMRPMSISAANAFSKVLGVRQEYLLCEDDYEDTFSLEESQKIQSSIDSASSELNHTFQNSLNDIIKTLKEKCSLNGFICSEKDLNEFRTEIEDFINMRFEKWLLPRSSKCILKINNISLPEVYLKQNSTFDITEELEDLFEKNPVLIEHFIKDFVERLDDTTPAERIKQWPKLLKRLKEYNVTIDFPQNFPLENIPESFYHSCMGIVAGIDLVSALNSHQSK